MINLEFAEASTPVPDQAWGKASDAERLALVVKALGGGKAPANAGVAVVAAKKDGQIIVTLGEPLSADRRGTLLLDIEEYLNDAVSPGLAVWLEPLGDRNSLRNLRGIEVKA